MAMVFVLINANIGQENNVSEDLKKIPEVKESFVVYGVYDVIARVEAESMPKLKEVISTKIRHLTSIKSTLTMIAV